MKCDFIRCGAIALVLMVSTTSFAIQSEYGVTPATNHQPQSPMTLWYGQPVTTQQCADPWMDYALPIGNGQLGGMVYGGLKQDIVQFNEKTLWTGSPTVRGAYQNFGWLHIDDTDNEQSGATYKDYYRQLDLTTATAETSWKSADEKTRYTTRYIASFPDRCIVVRLTADGRSRLNRRIYLQDAHGAKPEYNDAHGTIGGKLTSLSYGATMKVVAKGGKTLTDSMGIVVRGAKEILIVLSAGTDYSPTAAGYKADTSTFADDIYKRAEKAAARGWTVLYKTHLADYKRLYDRVNLNLDASNNIIPTDRLIDSYNTTATDAQRRLLQQLYFQYGRYLLIASSRGVDLPNNLQGIWNNDNNPGWQCDMHANINVQMNYWAAEKTNLSELHEKYLNYLYNMSQVQPEWRDYARQRCGQTTGWVNFTENNIFGHCTTWHNDYVEAGAWSCNHLWQHYRYTLDKDFLAQKALPVMLGAVDFWMERLVRDDKDGLWVCPNEWSPEHGPDKTITAHAQQIVWTLFDNTIEAIDVVGTKTAGLTSQRLDEIKAKFAQLDPGLDVETYHGNFGAERNGVKTGDEILREWKYVDFATGNGNEKDHRHLSHLMALYPFNNLSSTSPYYRPALNALRLRGLQSQGWSMGWKMCLWARAMEGDSCYHIFDQAFNHSRYYRINMSPEAGGVYYNLLDAHSPFQIDGNFGVCAGMAEMLLQNDRDTLLLLPALPRRWSNGEVTGLRAEGGYVVSMKWNGERLASARLEAETTGRCYIKEGGGRQPSRLVVTDSKGKTVETTATQGIVSFTTEKGKVYFIKKQ